MTIDSFKTDYYQRHNQRRLEHLSSLNLDIFSKTVIEVGAGIGDHTSFFVDRNCKVTSTDARDELVSIIAKRHPSVNAIVWNAEQKPLSYFSKFDIVYAYGILYHTKNPLNVIKNLSSISKGMLLLETCVSAKKNNSINIVNESNDFTQAFDNKGCRPSRFWIFNTLKKFFPYVYMTKTQPAHEEFPTDWNDVDQTLLTRAVFVASMKKISNKALEENILDNQTLAL